MPVGPPSGFPYEIIVSQSGMVLTERFLPPPLPFPPRLMDGRRVAPYTCDKQPQVNNAWNMLSVNLFSSQLVQPP